MFIKNGKKWGDYDIVMPVPVKIIKTCMCCFKTRVGYDKAYIIGVDQRRGNALAVTNGNFGWANSQLDRLLEENGYGLNRYLHTHLSIMLVSTNDCIMR